MTFKREHRLLIVSIVIVTAALAGIIVKIPPSNEMIIFAVIGLTTVLAYMISLLFLSKKHIILAVISVFLFLTINYLVGFQIVNMLLLLSGIIGMIVLLR